MATEVIEIMLLEWVEGQYEGRYLALRLIQEDYTTRQEIHAVCKLK